LAVGRSRRPAPPSHPRLETWFLRTAVTDGRTPERMIPNWSVPVPRTLREYQATPRTRQARRVSDPRASVARRADPGTVHGTFDPGAEG